MDPRETKIYTAVLSASILIGIIITYFIISFIRHQRGILQANRRNVLRETALLDQDRMRIAADLHDEIAPILSAVKFQIDSVDTANDEDQQVLITSKQQIDMLAVRLREIARDLMPASVNKKGLAAALDEFFTIIQKGGMLNIVFNYDVAAELPEDKRINLYRVIQEITQNTLKHAGASKLLVQVIQKNNIIEVVCEDNGNGFHYEKKLSEATGLGLQNLKNRAELIGTNFRVHSVIGKGTQYMFNIPLN